MIITFWFIELQKISYQKRSMNALELMDNSFHLEVHEMLMM